VNGVLVDETTFRATRAVVECDEAPAVEARGKDEPITIWEATEARNALDFYRAVGATLFFERCEALLREPKSA
jgi:class 3 adenylate cyclase